MLRRVALVRTDVSEELSAYIVRVIRIGELGTTLAVTTNRRTLRRNTLMKEALSSSETSIITRATWRNTPEDTILQHPSTHKSWHWLRRQVAVAQSAYFACRLKATKFSFSLMENVGESRRYCKARFSFRPILLTLVCSSLINPWGSVLHEKLLVAQVLKNFLTFYGNLRFIIVLTKALRWPVYPPCALLCYC
jgi:hypothetical protein